MNASRALVRTIATSSIRPAVKGEVAPGYLELHKVQQKFQQKDGKPVFLKGGTTDQILYRITMGLSMVGVGGILHLLYQLSFPQM